MTARRHVLAELFESARRGGPSIDLPAPEPWTEHAICAQTDPDAFYPDKGGSTKDAKRVCRSCPVIAECLAYALDHGDRYGVWGGLSWRERRKLLPSYDGPPRGVHATFPEAAA
jgi:WhiB family redox-sensing transcriptional regulator